LAAAIHWAEKISPGILEQLPEAERKIQSAERVIKELLSRTQTCRQQTDAQRAYKLLDEALPHLDTAIAEFEKYE
jgi:hypothetical protein